jgi:hypothetical protein
LVQASARALPGHCPGNHDHSVKAHSKSEHFRAMMYGHVCCFVGAHHMVEEEA